MSVDEEQPLAPQIWESRCLLTTIGVSFVVVLVGWAVIGSFFEGKACTVIVNSRPNSLPDSSSNHSSITSSLNPPVPLSNNSCLENQTQTATASPTGTQTTTTTPPPPPPFFPDIEIVTICTKATLAAFEGLLSTFVSYPVRILGLYDSIPYKNTRKIEIFHHYLTQQKNPNKIVLFADATDMYFCNCSRDIYETFLSYNVTILWSAELGCMPPFHINLDLFPNKSVHDHETWRPYLRPDKYSIFQDGPPRVYKQLNSGGFMGYVWALKRAFDIMLADGKKVLEIYDDYYTQNDQSHHVWYFLHYYQEHNLALDYSASIWSSLEALMPSVVDINNEQKYVYHRVFQKKVCILHGNGDGKDWMSLAIGACRPDDWSGNSTFGIKFKDEN